MIILLRRLFTGSLLAGAVFLSARAHSEKLYCRLKALTPSQRTVHEALSKRLYNGVLERRELPDGFSFRVDPVAVSVVELATWTQAEHLCCPFLRLDIEQEPDTGPLWLRVTGPEGTKDFLRAEIGDRTR